MKALKTSEKSFRAPDFKLESGEILPLAELKYQTYGSLNRSRSNVVIIPTHFGGTHRESTYLFGEGRSIDTDRYFIVVVNLLGNGLSTSPSNSDHPALFPKVSVADNVRLQKKMLQEEFGVERLALAVGFSMGAVQAYHWAALFPEQVERLAAICGSARVSAHNYVFLEGMKAALKADQSWQDGDYNVAPMQGLKAMARAWAAWPPSAHFYRDRLFENLGYRSVDEFLVGYWEATYTKMDANNVLSQIETWQTSDISANEKYGGDFDRALSEITAKTFVMPCANDAYFPPEDSAYEVKRIKNAELRIIDSQWGHWAGSGRNIEDTKVIDENLRELLESS
ncbi:alpha/beta fold hydrolase [Pseudomaricurvus alkylphenolicus]|uniref:alpha/beta fold hydrolase n=1 Tax=Pseudomaricurvus alkylphenolicus TaxID=1306991 RepID=UPI00141F7875|nr:alpha/beta fold hydrolase [Pseudomaricurvus alkylphenolicus]